MTIRAYDTPAAFKQALETRLKDASSSGLDFARRRQLLVYDRFLARVEHALGDAATLKGGLVLELRLERARTTKDVDLRLVGAPDNVLERLQEAGRLSLGDFMVFEIQPDAEHPAIQNDGMHYEGIRFRAECRMAGKIYGQTFGVDIAFGDPMLDAPEVIVAEDILDFAGVPPPTLRLYPVETHIAEKLHAYTLPRARPNSRVKDLPDLALLATVRKLQAMRLREAISQTFEFRKTHAIPSSLPAAPEAWRKPYARMADENDLRWRTLEQVIEAAQSFLDPVLSTERGDAARWSPTTWSWT